MLDEPKYWISLITGLLITFLSAVPLLNLLGWVEWELPFEMGTTILLWLVATGGAWLLISSFLSEDDMIMWISAGVALLISVIAIIQILFRFKIVGFEIPFLTITILQALFLIEGIGLIIAGFGDK